MVNQALSLDSTQALSNRVESMQVHIDVLHKIMYWILDMQKCESEYGVRECGFTV